MLDSILTFHYQVSLIVLWIVSTVSSSAYGRIVPVDWSNGGLTIANLTNEDTLVFTYNVAHNVVLAPDVAAYDACTGTVICAFTASPCSLDLAAHGNETLYLFCLPHCESGFKSAFEISLALNSTSSPSASPSFAPSLARTFSPNPVSLSPTVATLQPTTAGSTAVPSVLSTAAPSRNPTFFHVAEEEDGKLALFIQVDHSGSIRQANAKCRADSGKTCWALAVDFVENLVEKVVQNVGGYDNFRLYLSFFSCVPSSQNPIDKVMARPAMTSTQQQVQAALQRLRQVGDEKMYGTCPSEGAERILDLIRRERKWPKAYYIVTDGRVQASDRDEYKQQMTRIKSEIQKHDKQRDVCAMTIGQIPVKQDLVTVIRSKCVESVLDFVQAAQPEVAQRVANMLMSPRTTTAPSLPALQERGGIEASPGDSETAAAVVSITAVLGFSLVVLGLRRRKQQLAKEAEVETPTRTAASFAWPNGNTSGKRGLVVAESGGELPV